MINKRTRAKPRDLEYQIQVSIFQWISFHEKKYKGLDLAYSTASGLKLPIGSIVKAHKVGIIKKGLPDIVIPVSRKGFHGLYIELKTDEGKPTKEQVEFVKRLNEEGYLACFSYGFKETISKLEYYFT